MPTSERPQILYLPSQVRKSTGPAAKGAALRGTTVGAFMGAARSGGVQFEPFGAVCRPAAGQQNARTRLTRVSSLTCISAALRIAATRVRPGCVALSQQENVMIRQNDH